MGVRSVASVLLLAALAASLAACSTSEGQCAAPQASIVPSASAGDTVTVRVDNLYEGCADTGQGSNRHADDVTISLADADGEEVASANAPVAADATATVVLDIPATASGTYEVTADGTVVGTLSVVPAG